VRWWHIEGDQVIERAKHIASRTWLIFVERDLYAGLPCLVLRRMREKLTIVLHKTKAIKQLNSLFRKTLA
jgi:hypothetical protein